MFRIGRYGFGIPRWGGGTSSFFPQWGTHQNPIAETLELLDEVKTSLGFLVEQFKDLNASIRWMRDPAPPTKRAPRQP